MVSLIPLDARRRRVWIPAGRVLPIAMLLLFTVVAPVYAQDGKQSMTDPFGEAIKDLASRRSQILPSASGLALEGAIDGSAYVVGPGDVFAVSRGGSIPLSTPIQVSAEGNLVVPEVGSISIAGLTLDEAKLVAIEAIKRNYVNETVDVSLQEPRKFYVHVTGAVPQPGRILTSAVSRLDDVIQQVYANKSYDYNIAFSGRSPAAAEQLSRTIPLPSAERPSLGEMYRPSLRTIEIESRDGSTVSIDLMKYYATGDRSLNPYLQDGDVVRVQAYLNEVEAVRVSGPVPYAGFYPYREGDTAQDLLMIAFGSELFVVRTDVRVISRTEAGSESVILTPADVRSGLATRTVLKPGDHVMVTEDETFSAAVYGWVQYPGTYPIVAGTTTLKRLVSDAGGVRDEANVALAYVERRAPTFLKTDPGVSDLDFFGRVNFRQANSTTRILVDVSDALATDASFFVENGDVVVFPKEESTVYVVGNVPAGGYLVYRQGWNAGDYIRAAGGLADLSRDVYVFASVSGTSYKGLGQPVRPGDTVFVDREPTTDLPELQSLLMTERTSRRQLRLASFQTVITGISAIAAVITTVIAIQR